MSTLLSSARATRKAAASARPTLTTAPTHSHSHSAAAIVGRVRRTGMLLRCARGTPLHPRPPCTARLWRGGRTPLRTTFRHLCPRGASTRIPTRALALSRRGQSEKYVDCGANSVRDACKAAAARVSRALSLNCGPPTASGTRAAQAQGGCSRAEPAKLRSLYFEAEKGRGSRFQGDMPKPNLQKKVAVPNQGT